MKLSFHPQVQIAWRDSGLLPCIFLGEAEKSNEEETMKKKMAKSLAVLMCLMTAVAFMPTWAFAAESGEEQSEQIVSQEAEQLDEAVEQEAEEPAEADGTAVTMKLLAKTAKSQVMYVTLYDGGSVAADKNNKLMLNRKITVSDLNKDGMLSYAEALTAAHAAYCKGGKKGLEVTDSGWVKKLWGKETDDTFFLTNGEVNQDDATHHEVKKGDRLVAGFYIEPGENRYTDVMTSFDKGSASVLANHDLKLKMTYSGLMDYFNPTKNASISSDDEGYIVFGYIKDNGSFEAVDAEMDDDGYVTISFPKVGTYRLTCQGFAGDEAYVIGAPDVCTVTVTAAPNAKVLLTVNNKGVIAADKKGKKMINRSVTVKDINRDGYLMVDEAFVAAHKTYKKTKNYATQAGTYGLQISKFWGVSTTSVMYFINDASAMGVDSQEVKAGDAIYATVQKDSTGGADWYTWFDAKAKTVKVGENAALELRGIQGMSLGYGPDAPVANVKIGTAENKGKFKAINGAVTDKDGKASIHFAKKGTYYVSANGTVVDQVADYSNWPDVTYNDQELQINAPVCKVTVTKGDLSTASVVLSKTEYTYNGKAKKPAVTVYSKDGNKISKKNYRVYYKDNKKVGTATVSVKAKGKQFGGSTKAQFEIQPKAAN